MLKPQTLKGFRDFLPEEAKKRQYVSDRLRHVFALYGFQPLETPTLEYEELLMGKYGDEADKLVYRFEDHGKRRVAMRYDQTVPLARVIAQYQNELPMPFKRYQIQPVWRAENTQKGRFREFIQCDIDTVGSSAHLSDIEIIEVAFTALKALGFKKFTLKINNRKIFEELVRTIKQLKKNPDFVEEIENLYTLVSQLATSIDKLDKIGKEKVLEEIQTNSYLMTNLIQGQDHIRKISDFINLKPSFSIKETIEFLKKYFNRENLEWLYLIEQESKNLEKFGALLVPTLARGLNYYTGLIFEVEIDGYSAGSVVGGGRYDNLIGMFAGKQIPAVGCAFGFDRIIDAMNELKLFPSTIQEATTQILVTVFDESLKRKSLEACTQLRLNDIRTEIYLGANTKLDKQLKYADQKGIPFAVIIGAEEIEKNIVTVKDLKQRTQKQMVLDELILFLQTNKERQK